MADRNYNWDAIRDGLKRIGSKNPEFLANTVLVGGAACWYYRLTLSKANGPDFPVPVYTPDQERVWLSKDLDAKEWLNEAKESKTADNHFFAQDAPFSRRLHTAAAGLVPEHRAILHWIRHHVAQLPS